MHMNFPIIAFLLVREELPDFYIGWQVILMQGQLSQVEPDSCKKEVQDQLG